ncbi:MAG: hypothetical protein AB1422_13755 [bacterium]
MTNFTHFSAATLLKAAQSISIQRLFTTISTKRFIQMRRMLSSFGKRRWFTMSKPTEFSEVCRLNSPLNFWEGTPRQTSFATPLKEWNYEVEFEDGTKINTKDLDYKIIKPLIWWE